MPLAANVLVALVALLHLWFLVLEMFLWTTPRGRKTFGMTAEKAEATKVLAANQGLYNGFLAAGLGWGLLAGADGYPVKVFFLGCVIVAGIFGAATAARKILWVQAVPAAVALALVWPAGERRAGLALRLGRRLGIRRRGGERTRELAHFAAGFPADVEDEERIPRDRGEDQEGPEEKEGIFHARAEAGWAGAAGAAVSREPAIMPSAARPKDEAPATSGAIL